MATNSFTPLINNGDSQLQLQPQNEKSTARLTSSRSWRNSSSALAAVLYTFFGAAMLMMYIQLSSSSSSTTIDSSILSRDGNNNYPTYSPDGQSSSLRAAGAGAAAAATTTTLVSSSSSNNAAIVSGGCRTTGLAIPYNGGYQTFGEPLFNLDFTAHSYANRSWEDKRTFSRSDRFAFDDAWQGCAKQCNYENKCHTYTVHILRKNSYELRTDCYLHDSYKSTYNLDKVEWAPIGDTPWHISGVCRLN